MGYTSLDARQNTSIITGTLDNGEFQAVGVSPLGHFEVDIKRPLHPFGSLHTESAYTLFQGDGVYGINTALVDTSVSGSGSATSSNNLLITATGTTANSNAVIMSKQYLRYRAGQGLTAKFTTIFSAPTANSYLFCGLSNAEDFIGVGYKGTQFGMIYRKNGVREIQTLTVSTASTTAENITVTLAGVAFSVAVTNSGSTVKTAYEISKGTFTGWQAEQTGSTVRFVANVSGNKTGTFSITATTAVGSFAETKAGVDYTESFVAQTDFNADTINGVGPSAFTIDPTKLNIWWIGIQYLGAGTIQLDCETSSPTSGDVNRTIVHIVRNPNTLTTPNFGNPVFKYMIQAESTGSTTNISAASASYRGYIEGQRYLQGPRFTYFNTTTAVTAANYLNIFTVRNDLVFKSRASGVLVNILSIAAAIKHTNPVNILLIRNATLAGTPNFTAYASTSATDWDTAGTTVTYSSNDQLIWTGQLGETGQFNFSFNQDDVILLPGESFTVAARAVTGTPSWLTCSLNTREDQ